MFFYHRSAKIACATCAGLALIFVSPALASGKPTGPARPAARIVAKLDKSKVTVIAHSHPASVGSMTDAGRLPASTPLHGMTLVLKSSPEQEYALASLLDQQQKPGNANYHAWLTPREFGASFGIHADDLTVITQWLASSGFQVDKVAAGARFIQFSGTSGAVESAFHTEMHTYAANGHTRISNATDISLPEAITPVVRGLLRLNNFGAAGTGVPIQKGTVDADGTMHSAQPLLTTGSGPVGPTGTTAGTHFVGPGDLAKIYDTAPLLAKGLNGHGVSIGIVGSSDILPSDVSTYRSVFGLPVNPPTITPIGPDPGFAINDPFFGYAYEAQALVDTEIAGAVAPMANIVYVPTGYNDYDLLTPDLSAAYLVDENATDIIVDSFSMDEADLTGNGEGQGISYNYADVVFYQVLWEQAAAQGQSVFVTAGLTGADAASQTAGSAYGGTYNVNGMASTAYNVAVGSTEFNEGTASYATLGPTPFWGAASTGAPYLSALSYIPENAYNQGKYGTINGAAITGATGNAAGGGGISAYSLLPNWQVGPKASTNVPTLDPSPGTAYGTIPSTYYQVPGVAHRYVPDVAISNGSHDGVIYCIEGSCTVNSTGALQAFSVVNGASYLTAGPATMAAVQALINQQQAALNPNAPGSTRVGNPNFFYYRIAAAQSETACDSDTYIATGSTACAFHDIQTGNTYTPAARNGTTEVGWPAGVGFDFATGLGSPDAANLAALWASTTFSPTTVGFNVVDYSSSSNQVSPILITHGDYLALTVNVFPVDASGSPIGVSGTPTGDVAIIAQEAGQQGGVGYYTIGCANNPNPPAPYPGNTLCFGVPGDGNPYDSLNGGALNMAGTFPAIPGGTYNLYAHYAGDTIYAASNSQLVPVVVAPEVTTLEVDPYLMATNGTLTGPPTTTFTYGQNVYLDSFVNFTSGYGAPSGTIAYTLNNGTANLPTSTSKLDPSNDGYFDAGPGSGSTGYDVRPTYPVLPPGIYSISAAYSGDASFSPSTVTAFSIVVTPAASTVKTTVLEADIPSGKTTNLLVTVSNAAPAQFVGGYTALYATGTVTFVDTTTGVTLGTTTSAQMVNGAVTFTTPALTTAGANSIVATYNGDTNYSAKAATAATVTVTTGTASTTTVTAPATAQVGASDSLVATVTPTTATGAVYFYANGNEIGTATLSTTTHTATLAYKNFAVGTYSITATYAGSATVSASSTTTPATIVVTPNTPSVAISAPATGDGGSSYTIGATLILLPNNAGTSTLPNPVPNTAFNFYQGSTLLGSATAIYSPVTYQYIASFSSLAVAPGSSTITATFVGDANYATASASETVNLGATTLAFSVASPTSITAGTGQPVTFKAIVTPAVATVTAVGGTVLFYDGTTLLGTAVPVVSTTSSAGMTGVATISAVLSSAASHTINAVYSGDAHFTGSMGSLVANITTVTPAFSIALAPSSLTIEQGSSGATTVVATVTGNYAGTAPVTCTGLPTGAYCLFTFGTPSSPAFTFTGASTTYSGTLTVVTKNSFVAANKSAVSAGLLWLPALLFAGLLGVRRKHLSRLGWNIVLGALLLCVSLATTACGSQYMGTPLGTYNLTVTATGTGSSAASPNTTQTAPLSIVISQ